MWFFEGTVFFGGFRRGVCPKEDASVNMFGQGISCILLQESLASAVLAMPYHKSLLAAPSCAKECICLTQETYVLDP